MQYTVTFYSSGFFGFGEKGDFKYWSLAHFIPLILLLVAIFLIWRYREWFRNWKHEENFRFIFAFVMLMVEMSYFWRLLYVGSSEPTNVVDLLDKLPLQVCEWTCIISCFMLMKKSKNLYQICFFVCLTAGIFPLLTPAVITTCGPGYYRYYQFWLEHTLPIVAVFYMTFVHGARAQFKGIFYGIGFFVALVIPSLIANFNIEGANYLYLAENTDGDSIANILPENIWMRLLVFAAVVLPLFLGLYYLSRFLDKKFSKKQQTEIPADTQEK
ncbi:MAG: TIGR02206 family membrane protein [Clostridia bacterium]|nr:TIGR02206 family membrane protein [Clostridia bacterium]